MCAAIGSAVYIKKTSLSSNEAKGRSPQSKDAPFCQPYTSQRSIIMPRAHLIIYDKGRHGSSHIDQTQKLTQQTIVLKPAACSQMAGMRQMMHTLVTLTGCKKVF